MARYTVYVNGLDSSETRSELEHFFHLQPCIAIKAKVAGQKITFRFRKKYWDKQKIDAHLIALGFTLVARRKRTIERHRLYFIIALFLAPGSLYIAFSHFFQWPLLEERLALIITLTSATLIQFGLGWYYYWKVLQSLRKGKIRNSFPLMLATTVIYIYSFINLILSFTGHLTLGNDFNDYILFYLNALLFLFFLLAKAIEHSIGVYNRNYREALSHFSIGQIARVDGEETVMIDVQDVAIGDLIRVGPGQLVPLDGTIKAGYSYFDNSIITGDRLAVYCGENDRVFSGAVNKTHPVDVVVTSPWDQSLLFKITHEVRSSAKTNQAEEIRFNLIYQITLLIAIVAALVGVLFHYFVLARSLNDAISIGLTTLIVTIPLSLSLGKPITVMFGMKQFDQAGISVKSAHALDELARVDAAVFMHIGVLTPGVPWVRTYRSLSKEYDDVLYTIEKKSIFPLAATIVSYLETLGAKTVKMKMETLNGGRIKAQVGDDCYYFGSYAFAKSTIGNNSEIESFYLKEKEEAPIILFLLKNDQPVIMMSITDKLKETASPTIRHLRIEGVEPFLISSEKMEAVVATAKAVGITNHAHLFADVSPLDRLSCYQAVRHHYQHVLFVGDSLNDATCVLAADLSITINDGSRMALETSDIKLVNDDLTSIPRAIIIARRIARNKRQNIVFGTLFPILMIPFALTNLINSLMAIALLVACQLFVAINAFRIRTWKLD